MILIALPLIAYGLLAYKDRRAAFLLFCGALPAYLIRFRLAGVPTTALEVMFILLVAAWMWKREKRLIDLKGWGWLMLAWLAVATVALFVSPDFRAAAGVWKAYFIEPILFFILANDLLRTETDRDAALRSLAWSAIVVGGLAVIQHWTHWGVPPPFDGQPIPPATEAEFRSTSFYGFPNAVGLFLAPLVPLFVARAFTKEPRLRDRWLWPFAALLSVAAILFAQSEGALVGFAAGIGFLALASKKTRKPAIIFGAIALTALMLVPQSRALLVEKFTLTDWSGRVRTQMWGETWNMLKDHPLLGAGLSGYPIVFDRYHEARYIEIFQYPHQLVLDFWVELGIAGVLVFALLIWRFFATLVATKRPESIALAAAMIALLVHGLVDVPYFKNDLAILFWLLLALASSRLAETRKKA